MIVKTACARMDHGGCGLRIHVENGKIEKVEGDPEFPLNRGALCPKGLAHSERLHHPDRLLHPLKRVGLRGENRWKRISWNEALDTIALRFREAIQTDGPGSIAFAQGTPKGIELYLMIRLANLLQVPTVVTPGPVCHMPRETAAWLTCGFFPVPDYDHPPSLVLAWGSNLLQTNEEGVIGSQLGRALAQGAALITIDPRKTLLAQRSKCWLRPRPGSDLALALAFLKVIVEENRYDRQFIEKWTIGFEELREHLRNWSLPDLSSATWVPREQIQSAARLYSEMKPACLQWGNALEHTPQSVQCARAMVILEALTGNLDVPGGNVNRVPPPVQSLGEFVRSKNFPEKKERVLAPQFRLATQMGFTPSQILVKAILSGKPRSIRNLYIQGTNPLLSFADAQETLRALKALDFLAVAEIFMTPTAQLADLVLPAATHMEFDDIGHYGLPHGFILARPQVVPPPGECWPDAQILIELGKRMGLEGSFWPNLRACLEDILKPSGMTYDDFRKVGILKGKWRYRSYEEKGFPTPSKKVEIFSERLKDWGYDPLPTDHGSIEKKAQDVQISEGYPLILTSAKDPHYFHSAYRNLPSLRRLSPEPMVFIHPERAQALGIQEGDWVVIQTPRGSIRQRASLDPDLDPRVVIGAYGWWFPERKDLELSGWKESNINVLTDHQPPFDPAIGTTRLRAIPCRVLKD